MTHILETARLTLRPHGVEDFDGLRAMWADPAIVRYLGGVPSTPEDSWARLLRYAGSWSLLGYGFWAIRRRDTGDYIGDVGFLDAHRTGVEGFGGDPEIGWSLVGAAHGQGFATEAVTATLGWGGGRFRRCVAMINPDNDASVAVATRCGFRHFLMARYKDAPIALWEHRWR